VFLQEGSHSKFTDITQRYRITKKYGGHDTRWKRNNPTHNNMPQQIASSGRPNKLKKDDTTQ
jgi:hypothetical protein